MTSVRSRMLVEQSLFRGRSTREIALAAFATLLLVLLAASALSTVLSVVPGSSFDSLISMAAVTQLWSYVELTKQIRKHNTGDEISGAMLVLLFLSFGLRLIATHSPRMPESYAHACYVPDHFLGTEIYGMLEVACLASGFFGLMWLSKMRRQDQQVIGPIEKRLILVSVLASLALGYFTQTDCYTDEHGLGEDMLWMASQWMDAVALLPQFWLVSRSGHAERATANFMAAQVVAKVLSGVFWTHAAVAENLEVHHFFGAILSHAVCYLGAADYMYHFVMTLQLERLELDLAESCPV